MIDKPSVRLSISGVSIGPDLEAYGHEFDPCADWNDHYWKERFLKVHLGFRSRTHCSDLYRVRLEQAPSPHVGLGSGTQFACAASAILNAASNERFNAPARVSSQRLDQALTIDSGRGLRSHVGLYGFLYGQMLIDRGEALDALARGEPRTIVQGFPESWPIVLIHEEIYRGDSGASEQAIFDACSKRENPNRERMLELISEQIVPAVGSEDLPAFAEAIGRYGELAGGIFSRAVGDAYRTPRIRYWVDRLRALGFEGVGQSSWGPVVFVMVQDDQQAQWLLDRIRPDLLARGWAGATKVAGPASITSNR
jgi:predicted sugar kinase